MYDLNDTIVAISSPPSGARAIVRLTGPDTITICKQIFSPLISIERETRDPRFRGDRLAPAQAGGRRTNIITGSVSIDAELKVDAKLYLFLAPHSYTGDDVAEIHLNTNRSVIEALMNRLFGTGLRMAGPGEFTARAYLNGKIDLAQAEAVNEIVVSSNCYQLAAAEKLLSGRLAQTTDKVCSAIMDCLSLVEAGLDFSSEDIEFISPEKAVARLAEIKDQLEQLLSASIRYESVIDLPAVGIAGAPNAGKSSLLNKLLGKERSIVSDQRKTTRDVLTGELLLAHCRCVLFDCAGLTQKSEDRRQKPALSEAEGTEVLSSDIRPLSSVLDELAQQAAIQALRNSSVVVFCVDVSKTNWSEDIAIRKLITPKALVPIATKSDSVCQKVLANRIASLNDLFDAEFLPISVRTGVGLKRLRETIDRILLIDTGYSILDPRRESPQDALRRSIKNRATGISAGRLTAEHQATSVALTARHRQAVAEAIDSISEATNELKAGNDEIVAVMLRDAHKAISDIESATGGPGPVDEQILERIFSRFCIGK